MVDGGTHIPPRLLTDLLPHLLHEQEEQRKSEQKDQGHTEHHRGDQQDAPADPTGSRHANRAQGWEPSAAGWAAVPPGKRPCCCSTFCPAARVTSLTNSRAASGSAADLSTAIG